MPHYDDSDHLTKIYQHDALETRRFRRLMALRPPGYSIESGDLDAKGQQRYSLCYRGRPSVDLGTYEEAEAKLKKM